MPGSSNTSFIPKHTANKVERRSTPRQLYLGAILVRIVFIAVLLGAVGVFFFERDLNKKLNMEVTAFNEATKAFESEEEKLQDVVAFDNRLVAATNQFNNSISVVLLLQAIEAATIETVKITSLEVQREDEGAVSVTANIDTDSFDSVIFQRNILEKTEVLKVSSIEEVVLENPQSLIVKGENNKGIMINLKASIEVDPASITPLMVKDLPAVIPENSEDVNVVESTETMLEVSNNNSL